MYQQAFTVSNRSAHLLLLKGGPRPSRARSQASASDFASASSERRLKYMAKAMLGHLRYPSAATDSLRSHGATSLSRSYSLRFISILLRLREPLGQASSLRVTTTNRHQIL